VTCCDPACHVFSFFVCKIFGFGP